MRLFDIKLNEKIVRLVCYSNNDLAIIISLNYIKEYRYKYYIDVVNELIERIKSESVDSIEMIFFSHWLLIYELVRKEIVQSSVFPCVERNRFFKKLLENKVDFYTPDVVPSITQPNRKTKNDYNEIVSLLKKLVETKGKGLDDAEVIDAIDKIVYENSEKWTYK